MSTSKRKPKILIVDDDLKLLAAWTRALRRDHQVFAAPDASTARDIADDHRLDIAVVDLRLGSSSGIDLIRELRRDRPKLKIAMISGYLSVVDTFAAVQAGVDAVLPKPVMPREVLKCLEEGMPKSEDVWDDTPSMARMKWNHFVGVLADNNGNISRTARTLKIFRMTVQRNLKRRVPVGWPRPDRA